MNNIKNSIILPIYNVEKYLYDCLESIIQQTFNNIEIICINDGSTDTSLNILEKYKIKDKRITVITQENKGVSSARNKGLKLAKGEFVCFIDPDDWIDKNMLELMYKKAINKNADIVECDIIEHLENKDLTRIRKFKINTNFLKKIKILKGEPYNWKNIKNNILKIRAYSVNRIYRRQMLVDNLIEYPNYFGGEDYYFVLDSVLSANKIIYINKAFYHYRKRENSLSSGTGHTPQNSSNVTITDLIERTKNILEKHNVYEIFENEFENWKIECCFYLWQSKHIETRIFCQSFLNEEEQIKLESKVQNNNNKFLECLFSVKSEIVQCNLYKKISILGYRWYLKIK